MIRLVMVVAFLGLSCSLAFADGVNDPVFKMGSGNSSLVLTSDNFSFSVTAAEAAAGSVTFDFINGTGAVVDTLNLMAPGGFTFSCNNAGDPYFNNCTPQTATAGPTTISFFGQDDTHQGIPTAIFVVGPGCFHNDGDDDFDDLCYSYPAAADFSITIGGLTAGEVFTVAGTLNPTPEPSALVLLLAGGLGFLALKRTRFAY